MKEQDIGNGSDPEVDARPTRRRFTGEYKLRMLRQLDACSHGEVGALLRREGLYSSHIETWRGQRERGELEGLSPKKRGRKPVERNPLQDEVDKLRRDKSRLEARLKQAELTIDMQKKTLADVGNSPADGERRRKMIAIAEKYRVAIGTSAACTALAVSRATLYRRRRPVPQVYKRPRPHRALSEAERATMLTALNTPENVDKSPCAVYAELLNAGVHLCSARTMYRILDTSKQVRERRAQARHPKYAAPQLLATGPNQVWTWDISKLPTTAKWQYLHLYVMLDIFSRYVVGWMVEERENSELAQALIAASCAKQGIEPGQLSIHSDRGPQMMSKSVASLLADLGVVKSHSRPHVSNDNPFIESHFKTAKYRPDMPERFGGVHDGRAHFRQFFKWYNEGHAHSGIAYLTPAVAHYGQAPKVIAARQDALDAAYAQNPQRFVHGAPRAAALPKAVWINPPKLEEEKISAQIVL